jgi:hypothetical protein
VDDQTNGQPGLSTDAFAEAPGAEVAGNA